MITFFFQSKYTTIKLTSYSLFYELVLYNRHHHIKVVIDPVMFNIHTERTMIGKEYAMEDPYILVLLNNEQIKHFIGEHYHVLKKSKIKNPFDKIKIRVYIKCNFLFWKRAE